MKIVLVSGARPNYMKIAPIIWAIDESNQESATQIHAVLVHTGQHYDAQLFDVFFNDLRLAQPNYNLGIGPGSHAAQTAAIMKHFEPVLEKEGPDLVVVVGDVNSTVACAMTAAKMKIAVAHVEAGLRSFDRTMPEEINRVLTDAISDYLFTTERTAGENLLREGVCSGKIVFVGNTMIDSLLRSLKKAAALPLISEMGLDHRKYAVLTLHRPGNVDQPDVFTGIIEGLTRLGNHLPILFPCHPRTAARIRDFGLSGRFEPFSPKSPLSSGKIQLLEPMRYLEFLCLIGHAAVMLTDSGGIQEETTILGVPCLTLRQNTERPVTIEMGTNSLVGTNPDHIEAAGFRALQQGRRTDVAPPLWDGKAGERIVKYFIDHLKN